MMLPTHALVGLALATPVALVVPELAPAALLGGLIGGILPDLDLYVGHRRTLHYPEYFSMAAIGAVVLGVAAPTEPTVATACLLLAAAVHSVMDVFGGGLELRPWEATSERAVYDHRRGEWLAPRRWVRYDGAPEDLLLSVVVAAPLLVALDGVFRWTVVSALVVAAAYTVVRRLLPSVATWLVDHSLVQALPDRLLAHVPARYSGGHGLP
ncbi:metal-dependent hydrolase [Halococcus salsus]|uniref:metal-dependent hydrolase n=1 Tax=Halococcus salsus TaxID=2162894 RepID=UPI0013591B8A|nr:metal-dependent hydrolase [Halococcus salsus]